jgi:site-specific DNA-adenine methylase
MKTSHFIIPYDGNKRSEVGKIVESLEQKHPNWKDEIKTIVEPFAGTSAFSYYVSTLYPGRFKYIINDNDKNLIQLYHMMKDEKQYSEFKDVINKMIDDVKDKQHFRDLTKQKDKLNNWFLGRFSSHRNMNESR